MAPENHYEVIIIGTGAGGGTLAHALAPSDKRLLLLERGGYLRSNRFRVELIRGKDRNRRRTNRFSVDPGLWGEVVKIMINLNWMFLSLWLPSSLECTAKSGYLGHLTANAA